MAATSPAISIAQPFADSVVRGIKDIENRTWPTRFRGKILIHAGKRADREAMLDYKLDEGKYSKMALVGMVEIVDCVTKHRSHWFGGPYGFVLKNAVRFQKPIPYRGQLGIFQVPMKVLRGTRAEKARPGSAEAGVRLPEPPEEF